METAHVREETILQPGTYLDNYQLIKEIGHGGYATVYLARHYSRLVALKVLNVKADEQTRQTQEHVKHYTAKFVKEAYITAHLSQHRHIIRFEGHAVTGLQPYIVLEYVQKGSLTDLYPIGRRLPAAQVLLYVKQIASALHFIHSMGYIHCDIKPANVMMRGRDDLCLGDFGIAQKIHTLSASNTIAGTASYIAPEQLMHTPTFASDQYALAAMTYQWLTGHLPFSGTSEEVLSQHLWGTPLSVQAYRPELPQAIDDVLQCALAKQPEQRFPTIWAFAHMLELACEEAQLVESPLMDRNSKMSNSLFASTEMSSPVTCGSRPLRESRQRAQPSPGQRKAVLFTTSC